MHVFSPMLVVTAALVACQPRVHVANPSPFEEDDPTARRASDGDPCASGAGPDLSSIAPAGSADGSIRAVRPARRVIEVDRKTFAGELARGPGAFLRGVELTPYFRGQRFDGWEIVQFLPGDTRFDDIDLLPGDIIGRINGRLVARPPHLLSLWSELASARSVVVEIRRTGETFQLRVEVSDPDSQTTDDAAPAPEAATP